MSKLNCTELFFLREKENPKKTAVWLPNGLSATFEDLRALGASTQRLMRERGIGPGDTVLVFEPLGPRLYGAILGLMAMGVGVALVEPWMPVEKINHVLPFVAPKAFLTGAIGRLWGTRVAAIRAIPHWVNTWEIREETRLELHVEPMPGDSAGIITFTSGTTGNPKGMVRTQRYLVDQHRILSQALEEDKYPGADLCIFANFVLANLASGRSSVVIPPGWSVQNLRRLSDLPAGLEPQTLTCGPAFLLALMERADVPSLRNIHVGGALTDCAIFEAAFAKWPEAHWSHLYGSTEVEPVAFVDARRAVAASRDKGFFQVLCLGNPIPDITARLEPDTVWVTGPHVCPRYLANEEENLKYKKQDDQGRVWHRMGDRVRLEDGYWWYRGREGQPESEFLLEQRLYTKLQTSAAFIHHEESGRRVAYTQKARLRAPLIKKEFPEIAEVFPTRIRRDRRHRARIDRVASRNGGGTWLGG